MKHTKEWKSCSKLWYVPWPKGRDREKMLGYVRDNIKLAKKNPHELRVYSVLKTEFCHMKFGWQKWLAFRIFDFWSHKYGCVVEVDGATHDPIKDYLRDEAFFRRYAIITLRVRNGHQEDINWLRRVLPRLGTWKTRHRNMGIGIDATRLSEHHGVSLLKQFINSLHSESIRPNYAPEHVLPAKKRHPRLQKISGGKKRVRIPFHRKLNLY